MTIKLNGVGPTCYRTTFRWKLKGGYDKKEKTTGPSIRYRCHQLGRECAIEEIAHAENDKQGRRISANMKNLEVISAT
jgi:hypothetical protein